jgi:hypothetical protein
MNQRLAAGVLAGLSVALIAAETLAALAGLDVRLMLLFLSLYAGIVGLLFALRTLADGRREVIESVSERRARAKRDSRTGALLDAYGIDEEFIGRGFRERKPVAVSHPEPVGKGEAVRGSEPEAAPARDASPALSISIDKESFDDYIRRCMSEPGTCSDDDESGAGYAVDLDADGLSAMPSTPPTDFVHDPKVVMERFNRTAGGR